MEITQKGVNSNDCIHCMAEVKTPSERADKLMSPLVDLYSNAKEQQERIAQFKGYAQFLNGQKNKNECSNYKAVMLKFQKDFQKELAECEKGPVLLDRRKVICEWVLNTYSDKVIESFYAHWSVTGPKGEVKLIPGRTKEEIEGPIRAHESWCRKVRGNYKNKMFINCGEVTDWVKEFDLVKRVSESMKRDMESQNAAKPSSDDRERLFEEGCKYFDSNPATTFTKDLYLKCLTR